jgi:hypothetical protein
MSSSIPAAVTNLMALLKSVLPASTQISYGPVPGSNTNEIYLAPNTCFIYDVVGDQQPAEMGPNYRREETYSIYCEITAFEGDQDFLRTQQSCFSMFSQVEIAIANNPWLSTSGQNDDTAAVRYAEVGNIHFSPQLTPKGQSNGSLQFHVRCSQRINSLTA